MKDLGAKAFSYGYASPVLMAAACNDDGTVDVTQQSLQKTLFVIPDYQRGYRWTGREVEKLLKDLATFPGNQYCLQPLELQSINIGEAKKILGNKWKEGKFKHVYRLVDGQQRLTTISMIARGLGVEIDWDIFYEFENHTLFSELGNNNSQTINDCFRKIVAVEIADFISGGNGETLRQYFGIDSKKQIVFLKHEINDCNDPDGERAFSRLNAGKTPLTSSELIRALYMVNESGLTKEDRIEISKEWELIENTLADNAFWMMFNTKGLDRTPTRIDFLFSLVLNIDLNSTRANPRIIFEKLETLVLNKTADLMTVWQEIMRCFWWMQSCYNDIEVYNFLGWIAAKDKVENAKDASYIYQQFLAYPSLEDFKKRLIDIIQKEDFSEIDKIRYGDQKLKKLLLLLNVLTCNKGNERFRFDLLESCDVEHVDSQTPNDLSKPNARYEWLLSVWREAKENERADISRVISDSFQGWKICDEDDIVSFCKENCFGVDFAKKIYDPKQSFDENGFGNLALLNSSINRSYHNDIFPQKRKRIRDELIEGTLYIPPCTARVFTKFYTKKAVRITCWLDNDYDDYKNEMKELLDVFSSRPSIEEREGVLPPLVGVKQEESSYSTFPPEEQEKNLLPSPVCFSDFMEKYSVNVPEIQRLYVQGRQDAYGKKCLKGFALNLVESAVTGAKQPLDMIYGIETKNIFQPLDGQQRLTTLLLLSWLLNKVGNRWSFRYKSRRATEVFIKKLLQEEPPPITHANIDEIEKKKKDKFGEHADEKYLPLVREYLYSKAWFLAIWDNDPGIHGMLEMLDSLYDKLIFARKIFKDKTIRDEISWDIDQVSFDINYLNIHDSAYDQIFLKMNSRGKELSPWENVKAILKSHVPESICADDWHRQINFDWPEKLWHDWKNECSIENLDARFLEIVSYALRFAGYKGPQSDAFEIDKWLRETEAKTRDKFFHCTIILFSAIVDTDCGSFLTPAWSQKPILPDLTKKVQDFQKPLVVFFAAKVGNNLSDDWKRVVWNIVENSVDNVDSMIACLRLFDQLAKQVYTKDILSVLSGDVELLDHYSYHEQLKEEREKARQILNHKMNCQVCDDGQPWKCVIKKAEESAFFHGCIRFLYRDSQNHVNWSDFDKKFNNASLFFSADGVKNPYSQDAKLLRGLLSRTQSFEDFWGWCYTPANSSKVWLGILKNPSLLPAVHTLLLNGWDDLYLNSSLCVNATGLQTSVVNSLIKTNILANDNIPHGARLYWTGSHYCLRHSARGDRGYYYISEPRLDLLTDAVLNGCIQCEQHITGTKVFRGSRDANIDFTYNVHEFQWYGSPGENEADIYLMENGDYAKRTNWTKSQPDLKNYFCKIFKQEMTIEKFCNILNELITEYRCQVINAEES